MTTAATVFAQYRVHVAAAVAWERRLLDRMLRALRLRPPSQDGMFEGLMDDLLARWPLEAQEGRAMLRRDGVRWAKLHEPAMVTLPLAA